MCEDEDDDEKKEQKKKKKKNDEPEVCLHPISAVNLLHFRSSCATVYLYICILFGAVLAHIRAQPGAN